MMYVAPRVGESIEISDDVVLTVVSITGGTVRLGVTAPPSFPVELDESTPHDSTPLRISFFISLQGRVLAISFGVSPPRRA